MSLADWHYDKEKNRMMKYLSIDISRDLKSMEGSIQEKEFSAYSYFYSQH